MVAMTELWHAILLSAVLVFVASSIIWMALPIHKHDYKDPGDKEGPLLDALRSAGLRTGVYFVPWCQGKSKDEVARRMKSDVWALVSVLPGAPNMGKMLGAWLAHQLVVAVFVAYVLTSSGMAPGTAYLTVFRVAGATSLLAHAGYAVPMSIWNGQPWSTVPGRLFDGVVYALLTAGAFAWLWPEATPA